MLRYWAEVLFGFEDQPEQNPPPPSPKEPVLRLAYEIIRQEYLQDIETFKERYSYTGDSWEEYAERGVTYKHGAVSVNLFVRDNCGHALINGYSHGYEKCLKGLKRHISFVQVGNEKFYFTDCLMSEIADVIKLLFLNRGIHFREFQQEQEEERKERRRLERLKREQDKVEDAIAIIRGIEPPSKRKNCGHCTWGKNGDPCEVCRRELEKAEEGVDPRLKICTEEE